LRCGLQFAEKCLNLGLGIKYKSFFSYYQKNSHTMSNISLQTPQNVTIDYTLASSGERAAAFILDTIIIWAWSTACSLLGIAFFGDEGEGLFYVIFLLILPVVFFYHLALEHLWQGQSIGKRILKIKVVKLNGELPSNNELLLRWAFRMVDVASSFTFLAAILIITSKNKQRLGDI
jgi:uncharacterized RDD family membrane protein YckC